MKYRVVSILLTIVVLAGMFVSGCGNDEEMVTADELANNRWLAMLRIMPENDNTRYGAYVQTTEYADLIREFTENDPNIPGNVPTTLAAHKNLPMFFKGEYTDEEWKSTLGFSVNDVTESIYAGSAPPSEYQAVRGDFTAEDIETAALTGPLNEFLEIREYEGYEYYSWGDDFGINLQWRSGIRNLGRGHRLAYVDGFGLWMLWTGGLEEMIDAWKGNIPSLADNEYYRLLAPELDKMDTVTAFFSTESLTREQYIEVNQERFDRLMADGYQDQIDAFRNEPVLKPFQAFATGAGTDGRGTFMTIILLNPDEETAEANEYRLRERFKDAYRYPGEVNSPKWMDSSTIERFEVTSEGRFTTATLHGRIGLSWDSFGMYGGPYSSLLLSE